MADTDSSASSSASSSGAPSARTRLLVTAERMIAEQGVAVSLREIATAAGQRNNSAVQYYFGSRDALIEEIVELRQESLERERLTLIALHEAEQRSDLDSLLEALVAPMFHAPYAEGSTHYARFLEKVRDHPALIQRAMSADHWPASRILVGRIRKQLDPLPDRVRDTRLRALMITMFALLADSERAREAGRRGEAFGERQVVDMLHGLLTAPVSARPARGAASAGH